MPVKKRECTYDPDRYIWERQAWETPKAYASFCIYRDLPYRDKNNVLQAEIQRNRNMKDVAKERGVSESVIEKMGTAHKWVQRARAYDEQIDEMHRQEQEAEIIAMRRLHAKIAQQMVNKAARKFLQVTESDMSVSDAVKMFEVGVKYERLSRGDTTDNQSINLGKETTTGMASLVKSLQRAREKMQQGE